jgi:hypothetical protein
MGRTCKQIHMYFVRPGKTDRDPVGMSVAMNRGTRGKQLDFAPTELLAIFTCAAIKI